MQLLYGNGFRDQCFAFSGLGSAFVHEETEGLVSTEVDSRRTDWDVEGRPLGLSLNAPIGE